MFEDSLSGEPPELIEWAFMKHFEVSPFFPKPADITQQIKNWRETRIQDYHSTPKDEWEAAQQSQKEYFASPEYAEAKKKVEAAFQKQKKAV